ncbi:MAG: DUF2238 domain-containing protein [Candidatus Nomurabacteria bacterium]|nr:DUF2238 domain-containing protein [Candidatus Nomurabacteria bacterium]
MNKLISLIKKIFIIIAIGLFCVEALKNNWFYAIYALAVIPIAMIFDLIKYATKFRISQKMELLYLTFIFFAEILGINLRVYYLLPAYDKIIHLISGALTAILAIIILRYFKISASQKSFWTIFILSLTAGIAVAWEVFEYIIDLFGGDMQRTSTRGINDTMVDMIAALIGGGLVALFVRRSKKMVKQSGDC